MTTQQQLKAIKDMINIGKLVPLEDTCIKRKTEADRTIEYLLQNSNRMHFDPIKGYYELVEFEDAKRDRYIINLKDTETAKNLSDILYNANRNATRNNDDTINDILNNKTSNGYFNIYFYADFSKKPILVSLHRLVYLMTAAIDVINYTINYKSKGYMSYHLNHLAGLEIINQPGKRYDKENIWELRPNPNYAGLMVHPTNMEICTSQQNNFHQTVLKENKKYLLDIPRRITFADANVLKSKLELWKEIGCTDEQIIDLVDSYFKSQGKEPRLILA